MSSCHVLFNNHYQIILTLINVDLFDSLVHCAIFDDLTNTKCAESDINSIDCLVNSFIVLVHITHEVKLVLIV